MSIGIGAITTTLATRVRPRLLATAAAAAVTSGAVLVMTAGPAAAMSAPIQTTAYVNVRPGPSVSSGSPLAVMPPGTSPDFNCWTQGQNIGGVDVWFSINYHGVTGYYASYYDNSSYSTDSQITSKYGIPHCGSAAAQNAANWAAAHVGQNYDNGLCLAFVFQAWAAAGVNLRNYVTVPINGNTYPVDIWKHFNTGTIGGGSQPPVGALVFYANKQGNRTLSHVAISVGGGRTVSTSDGVAPNVHYEAIAQHSYANYLGWWLP
jgi:cell wall-associated NlpC family hydrolase